MSRHFVPRQKIVVGKIGGTTVEPPSKGHSGTVHCREDVFFSEVSKCIITMGIATFKTLWSVLHERLSLSQRILKWKFHCSWNTDSGHSLLTLRVCPLVLPWKTHPSLDQWWLFYTDRKASGFESECFLFSLLANSPTWHIKQRLLGLCRLTMLVLRPLKYNVDSVWIWWKLIGTTSRYLCKASSHNYCGTSVYCNKHLS